MSEFGRIIRNHQHCSTAYHYTDKELQSISGQGAFTLRQYISMLINLAGDYGDCIVYAADRTPLTDAFFAEKDGETPDRVVIG